MKLRTSALFLLVIAGTFASGCSKHKCIKADDRVQAAVWMHNAAEYEYICESVYQTARPALIKALENTGTTASIEQEKMGNYEELPPAIVLDLDETVIDNGPFQGHIVKHGKNFNPDTWKEWSVLKDAKPLAGAVEFLQFARDNGVTPIYVSNRIGGEKADTIENLKAIGIPADENVVFLKYENGHPDWTSDKASRREYVARRYRILLLFGDDLNDFVTVKGMSSKERFAASEGYRDNFGKKWFILPNPSYGSWEPAVFGGKYIGDRAKEHEVKINALKDFK